MMVEGSGLTSPPSWVESGVRNRNCRASCSSQTEGTTYKGSGLQPESQGQNLALTILCAPLDSAARNRCLVSFRVEG